VRTIDRFLVRETQMGSGLLLVFDNGRKKSLTLSLDSNGVTLPEAAAQLNYTLHCSKHDHRSI
jgi:hypothetical protein